jgi:integrase
MTWMTYSAPTGVRIEDISDLMGHSGTSVTETVYRHETRPALTTAATAMNKILKTRRTSPRQATSA